MKNYKDPWDRESSKTISKEIEEELLRRKKDEVSKSRTGIKNTYSKSNFEWPYEIVEDTWKDVFDILFTNLTESEVLKKWESFKLDEDYTLKKMFVRSSCWKNIIKWNRLQKHWVNLPRIEVVKKIIKEPKADFLYDSNWQKTHKLNRLYDSYRIIEEVS